jgi:hypothetical protein
VLKIAANVTVVDVAVADAADMIADAQVDGCEGLGCGDAVRASLRLRASFTTQPTPSPEAAATCADVDPEC